MVKKKIMSAFVIFIIFLVHREKKTSYARQWSNEIHKAQRKLSNLAFVKEDHT